MENSGFEFVIQRMEECENIFYFLALVDRISTHYPVTQTLVLPSMKPLIHQSGTRSCIR